MRGSWRVRCGNTMPAALLIAGAMRAVSPAASTRETAWSRARSLEPPAALPLTRATRRGDNGVRTGGW